MTQEMQVTPPTVDDVQLTQVQVPLSRAGHVFAHRDARGRTPLVLVPENPHRLRNEIMIAGVIVLVVGVGAGILLKTWGLIPLGVALGLVLIGLGIYRSFLVRIPEGTMALLSRGARYVRDLGAGTHVVPPWFAISHLVTQREVPYDVPAVEALTSDHVRVTVDTMITFTITEPYRFVYSLTAEDFDEVLLAICLDAIRGQVRRIPSEEIVDLAQQETSGMRQALSDGVEAYGVTIKRVNVTDVRPPEAFLRSHEDRQLAVFQRAEQAEKQALAQRVQADVEALARQELIARIEREREELQAQVQQAETRKRIAKLEAEAEELRLSTLEDRLLKYPQAAQYELQRTQLDIARALAGNARALLQIGSADNILRPFVLRQFVQDTSPSSGSVSEESAEG